MKDNEKFRTLIDIPADGNYIEILGHRIDGFESFEAFLEHLKKYAELEETVNRQKAEIERLNGCVKTEDEVRAIAAAVIKTSIKIIKAEAVKEFAERLKDYYTKKKIYDRPNAHTLIGFLFSLIDDIAEEMVGAESGN